jgi:hypothetical protein
MKNYLLAAGLLLAGCSSPAAKTEGVEHKVVARKAIEPVAPPLAYQVTKVARSRNLLITTTSYTGVILREEKLRQWGDGFTARAITPAEVLQAEVILQRCVSPEKVTWYWYDLKSDSLNGLRQEWTAKAQGISLGYPTLQPKLLYPLNTFSRQYVGLRTLTGQRVIWINALINIQDVSILESNWYKKVVEMQDGGPGYFNVYVNLDTGQCLNFYRGSLALGPARNGEAFLRSLVAL